MQDRQLYVNIWRELIRDKSMVFLAGPRQSGKTTLAQIISRSFTNSLYFNWDIAQDRPLLIENPAFFEDMERKDSSEPFIVFDEIHKYKLWKNYLKGIYDQFHQSYRFLVSGSGRLDIYQKGGDSLAGRYLIFHLWPFTVAELGNRRRRIKEFIKDPLYIDMKQKDRLANLWHKLSKFSGFPEPYLLGRTASYNRWSNTYSQQLIREDIRDLTGIKSVSNLETLYYLLPSRVGSPISVPSLSRDLKVSYNSVRTWISAFERFFLVFSISPWTSKIVRSIQKERKIYMWDSPRIQDASARFENMIAIELWRAITSWNDMGYGFFSLHFIKNKEQQEVDFLIAERNKPLVLIEAKLTDTKPSAALKRFQTALGIPAVQLTEKGEGFRILSQGGQSVLIAPAYQWLSLLP